MNDEVIPRITGLEHEWGLLLKMQENGPYEIPTSHFCKQQMLLENMPPGIFYKGYFLSNGAKYYRDAGGQLEYATPEDTSLWGTVTNEIAGERIVIASLEALRKSGHIYQYYLNKRVIDDVGNSCGHHENYLSYPNKVPLNDKTQIEHLALLAIHLATRNVWAGAGHVESVNGENTFYTSQKVGTLEEVFSLSTTDPKPLVNLRNEPLSAGNRYNRVHVTSGDANMSPWAIWMTLGTTSIVLRMIEDGDTIGDLASQNNALVVAQSVRSDFNLTEQIEMANGIKVTALDMQGNLIMRARQLEARGLLSTEEVPVLREWERVIDDLRIDQLRTIDRIDWVAKYNLILSYVDSRGVDFKTSTKPPLLDKLWGEMSPQGLGLKHREGAGKQWMPSEDKIKTAITTPPQTTRAKVRGGFIKAYSKVPTYDVADWHFLKLGTSKDKKLDPYDTKELKVA